MTTKTKVKTRDRILEIALAMFNEKGTTAVTTNHIAAEAGISPGNLYYHFRNREEIIRNIFKMMEFESREGFEPITHRAHTIGLQVFEETFAFIQQFNRRFIFFKRELPILLMRDAELKERFDTVHEETLSLIQALIDSAVTTGLLRQLEDEERELLAEMSWMLTLFWPNYLEISGEANFDRGLERGIAMMKMLIKEFSTTA